ncbi:DUF2306 domain-containing protein [Actinomadura sp. NPDC000600]|uniref:DUF2306 domain-containing protein n=1 Tax=Actinomadura sp. NPDC000600 TaxID=3154262 RepID=UPI00339B14A1
MLLDSVIVVHIAAGLTAVVTGIVAMRVPKRPGRHPRSGRVYLGALVVVAVTASGIAAVRPRTTYLLIFGALALTSAGAGYAARRMRWHGWPRHHMAAMAISYITLLTAFYVDNGPRLPLWKLLPPITFWFLPTGIGLPLLLRALHRFPSSTRPDPTFREEAAP